jgi:CheY-like chemotaxis protein
MHVCPLLEHVLLSGGNQVTTADSLAPALSHLRSQCSELIGMDVNLPDGSGMITADEALAADLNVLTVQGLSVNLGQPGKI